MKVQLMDADYVTKNDKAIIRLVVKHKRFLRLYDSDFAPYFYVIPRNTSLEETEKQLMQLAVDLPTGKARITKTERAERLLFGRTTTMFRAFAAHPSHVKPLRERVRLFADVYEADILFARRYLIDKNLRAFDMLDLKTKKREIQSITSREAPNEHPKLRTLAFDIETYNPHGMPRPEKDPIIMISYADDASGVLTYKKISGDFVRMFKDEREIIEEFCRIIKAKDTELLIGYNDVDFDLPYLKSRAKALGIPLQLGRDGSSFTARSHGLFKYAKIKGRIHVDLYPVAKFLALIGALKTKRLTLGDVYEELFNEEGKKKVKKLDIWKLWESQNPEDLYTLADYSLHDSIATRRIADEVLPLEIELAKLVGVPLGEIPGATTGQLVEMLLMREAYQQNRIVPNKPAGEEVSIREQNPVQGAYVKLPEAGIYENLAVFDFRGMYPSIIIAHNIDMDSLNCTCCPDSKNISPTGARFCEKKQGLIPSVLNRLISERDSLKKQLKAHQQESPEYKPLFARSQALKIISNSFYGFLLYARSRWYSRPCGESVTAYGRHYIQDAIKKFDEAGMHVLYSDTDSLVIQLGSKKKEDALALTKSINAALPERMELELEGFYPRGVFVSKKHTKDAVGAKKKYALISEDGRIKIRGFELVRRDWSRIARHTQQRVLEAILKEGSKEKALEIARQAIDDLRSHRTKIEDCIIYTSIRKGIDNYEIKSPEVAAAQKARKAGIHVEVGTLIGYVITPSGKSVSDRAQPAELAKEYDASYYIDHQVMPAVMKILSELGYEEADLKMGGKQARLGEW